MDTKNQDFDKHFKTLSSRHHYIPKFLINGFTNEDGLLYVYDKQKDEIIKKPRSSKSIFFENDRNTLEIHKGTKTSMLEDLFYKKIDDITSRIIKQYQTGNLPDINLTTEDTGTFLFFLLSLFWRIPKSDYAANNLMDRSTITADGVDIEALKADPAYRKINRAKLFKHHIDEMKKFGSKGTKWANIHQIGDPIYLVIGDYPILFRNQSGLFSEFNDTDILIAISSDRIYSSTNEKINIFQSINFWRYNACIINQSVRYVACGNLKALEYSILFYKTLKDSGHICILHEEVFKNS